MTEKEIISFRGDKEIWDRWVLKLREQKIQIWEKIRIFIEEDLKKK